MTDRRLATPAGRTRAAFALVVLTSTLACGGGGGDPVTIDWDLSASHTKQDIGEEPDPDTNHYGIRSVESIRVALPGDRVFEAGDVQDIRIDAPDDEVETISVVLNPRTAEEAHERAVALAEKWDLSRDNLDDWLAEIRSGREEGGREADVGSALAVDGGIDPVPFAPSVEIRYSFDDDKPWVVSFEMFWDSEIQ